MPEHQASDPSQPSRGRPPSVRAEWSSTRDGAINLFSVACSCGAASSAYVECGATRVALAGAERRAWSSFLREARRATCKACLDAAGRWLRGERAAV